MFKRIHSSAQSIRIRFEEKEIDAQAGDSVAAALLGAGVIEFRSVADSGEHRGPYCMIGNCFECLVEIDGEPNRQACQEKIYEGMQIRKQQGLRKLRPVDES